MHKFTCAGCKNEFETSTSPEEKAKEFFEEYGHIESESDEEVFSTCDYCHSLIMEAKYGQP